MVRIETQLYIQSQNGNRQVKALYQIRGTSKCLHNGQKRISNITINSYFERKGAPAFSLEVFILYANAVLPIYISHKASRRRMLFRGKPPFFSLALKCRSLPPSQLLPSRKIVLKLTCFIDLNIQSVQSQYLCRISKGVECFSDLVKQINSGTFENLKGS